MQRRCTNCGLLQGKEEDLLSGHCEAGACTAKFCSVGCRETHSQTVVHKAWHACMGRGALQERLPTGQITMRLDGLEESGCLEYNSVTAGAMVLNGIWGKTSMLSQPLCIVDFRSWLFHLTAGSDASGVFAGAEDTVLFAGAGAGAGGSAAAAAAPAIRARGRCQTRKSRRKPTSHVVVPFRLDFRIPATEEDRVQWMKDCSLWSPSNDKFAADAFAADSALCMIVLTHICRKVPVVQVSWPPTAVALKSLGLLSLHPSPDMQKRLGSPVFCPVWSCVLMPLDDQWYFGISDIGPQVGTLQQWAAYYATTCVVWIGLQTEAFVSRGEECPAALKKAVNSVIRNRFFEVFVDIDESKPLVTFSLDHFFPRAARVWNGKSGGHKH